MRSSSNNRPVQDGESRKRSTNRRRLIAVSAVLSITVIAISCGTVNRTVLAPPNIPGAEFVGSQTCAECHEDIVKGFKSATHTRLKAPGDNSKNVGCESCHGPGSIHNQAGGGRGNIVNPRKSPETCFQCHLDKRGEFSLPYHHPVLEGKVSCADCHNPHKGPVVKGGSTALLGENETCGKCHTVQFGPFVFEHEALREGCTTCHRVHGSVNQKMLVSRNQTLCLKCHFQQQTTAGSIIIGGQNHTSFLSRGTCWSGGCHEAVHGSQIGTSMRY